MKLLLTSAALAILAVAAQAQNLDADAYATVTPDGSNFDYDIHLTDAGDTNIGTFWFSWIPGFSFMPVDPTNIGSPTGWSATMFHENNGIGGTGASIQWVATNPMHSGDVLDGFTFTSSLSPQELGGMVGNNPMADAFVYHAGPFSDSGYGFTVNPLPEPSALAGLSIGALALFIRKRKR